MAVWRYGYASSDGESIYWEAGGSGAVVIICHGAGSNHISFFQQMAGLASDHTQVVLWDQRGYGNSTSHDKHVGISTAARDLSAVLEAVGAMECRVHLIGQAMGAFVAAAWALANPRRVATLALWDGPFAVSDSGKLAWALKPNDKTISANRADPQVGVAGAVSLEFSRREPVKAYLYQTVQNIGNTKPSYSALFAAAEAEPVDIVALAALGIPVLFGRGENDPVADPVEYEKLASLIPTANLKTIPSAGHSPYFEAPELWNAAVMAHVREVEPAPAKLG